MMKKLAVLLLSILFLAQGYAQVATRGRDVLVLGVYESAPENAKPVDKIEVKGRSGADGCDYQSVVGNSKEHTGELGGNLLKITEIKYPGNGRSCYRVQGDVLYVNDMPTLLAARQRSVDSLRNLLIPDTASYALSCIYRSGLEGNNESAIKVFVDDSEVCRLKSDTKYIIRLPKSGPTVIAPAKKGKGAITLDVKPRQLYFVHGLVDIFYGPMASVTEVVLRQDPSNWGISEFEQVNFGREHKPRKKTKEADRGEDGE